VVNHLIVALQGREPVSTEHHVTREDLFSAKHQSGLSFGPLELTESVGLSYFWRTMMLE
jgi:hypothetical protein